MLQEDTVVSSLGPERFDQHPPCALARDLIQQQKLLTRFPLIPFLDYLQPSVASPSNRLPPGFAFALSGRVRRLFHARIRSTTFGNSSAVSFVSLSTAFWRISVERDCRSVRVTIRSPGMRSSEQRMNQIRR